MRDRFHDNPELQKRLDDTCERFDAACKAAGTFGLMPSLESYIEQAPVVLWKQLLHQLTKTEFQYHQQRMKVRKTLERLTTKLAPLTFKDIIGRGGMGTVYQAVDRQGQLVAVKVLLPEFSREKEWGERFEREAEILSRIKHDHIIALRPIPTGDGNTGSSFMGKRDRFVYFVMEYAERGSLREIVGKTGMSATDAIDIILQVCKGLKHAHDSDVIHRDIKPENLLIDALGQVKIADFGLAKVPDSLQTRTGQVIGTPAYMAPEQQLGTRGVDRRADIYSLGVVFYELLTGTRPSREQPFDDRMSKLVHVDKWVRDVVLRSLADNPDQRYQQIGDLINAIHLGPSVRTPAFDLGAIIECRWNGGATYYKGRIAGVDGDRFQVDYEDGSREWTTADLIRPLGTSSLGRAVYSRWRSGADYYKGTITEVDGNRLHVAYVDGDKEWTTADLVLAVGAIVYGRWKRGVRFFRGTVTGIDGDRIQIDYDDGDKEWTTADMIKHGLE